MSSVDDIWKELNGPARTNNRGQASAAIMSGLQSSKRKSAKPSIVKLPGVGAVAVSGAIPAVSAAKRSDAAQERSAAAAEPATLKFPDDPSADEILAVLQHDVNCMADGSVGLRRVAARRVRQSLFPDGLGWRKVVETTDSLALIASESDSDDGSNQLVVFSAEPAVPAGIIPDVFSALLKTLLHRLADSADAVRELSAEMTPDLGHALPYLIPALTERVTCPTGFDVEQHMFVSDSDVYLARQRGRLVAEAPKHTHKVVDGAEEVRLALCTLLHCLVQVAAERGVAPMLEPYAHELVVMGRSFMSDPYPLLKRRGMRLLMALSVIMPGAVKHYARALARDGALNVDHRTSKVRLTAVAFLEQIIAFPNPDKGRSAGGEAILDLLGQGDPNIVNIKVFYQRDTTINYFAKLCIDNSPAVRSRYFAMLGRWLTTMLDRTDWEPRLSAYLMAGVGDSVDSVAKETLYWLGQLGELYEKEHEDDIIDAKQYGVQGRAGLDYQYPLPRPFEERPSLGQRLWVRSHCRRFMPAIMGELARFNGPEQRSASSLLLYVTLHMEEYTTQDMHVLLPTLLRLVDMDPVARSETERTGSDFAEHEAVSVHGAAPAMDIKQLSKSTLERLAAHIAAADFPVEAVEDVDPVVRAQAEACAQIVGRFCPPESYVPLLTARIMGSESVATQVQAGTQASAVRLLTLLVAAAPASKLVKHLPDLVAVLDAPSIRDSTPLSSRLLRHALVDFTLALVAQLFGRLRSLVGVSFDATGRLPDMDKHVRGIIRAILWLRGRVYAGLPVRPCTVSRIEAGSASEFLPALLPALRQPLAAGQHDASQLRARPEDRPSAAAQDQLLYRLDVGLAALAYSCTEGWGTQHLLRAHGPALAAEVLQSYELDQFWHACHPDQFALENLLGLSPSDAVGHIAPMVLDLIGSVCGGTEVTALLEQRETVADGGLTERRKAARATVGAAFDEVTPRMLATLTNLLNTAAPSVWTPPRQRLVVGSVIAGLAFSGPGAAASSDHTAVETIFRLWQLATPAVKAPVEQQLAPLPDSDDDFGDWTHGAVVAASGSTSAILPGLPATATWSSGIHRAALLHQTRCVLGAWTAMNDGAVAADVALALVLLGRTLYASNATAPLGTVALDGPRMSAAAGFTLSAAASGLSGEGATVEGASWVQLALVWLGMTWSEVAVPDGVRPGGYGDVCRVLEGAAELVQQVVSRGAVSEAQTQLSSVWAEAWGAAELQWLVSACDGVSDEAVLGNATRALQAAGEHEEAVGTSTADDGSEDDMPTDDTIDRIAGAVHQMASVIMSPRRAGAVVRAALPAEAGMSRRALQLIGHVDMLRAVQ